MRGIDGCRDSGRKTWNDNGVVVESFCINLPSEQLFRLQERFIAEQEQA